MQMFEDESTEKNSTIIQIKQLLNMENRRHIETQVVVCKIHRQHAGSCRKSIFDTELITDEYSSVHICIYLREEAAVGWLRPMEGKDADEPSRFPYKAEYMLLSYMYEL